METLSIIQTKGAVTKKEVLIPVTYNVLENTSVAEIKEPYSDYYGAYPDKLRPNSKEQGIGFFQIGGGIAGDFPICVVHMMTQDHEKKNIPYWSYFCQISDSTISYGFYS